MIAGISLEVGAGDGCRAEKLARCGDACRGSGGRAAADGGDVAERAIRKSVRLEPECGHGMGAGAASGSGVSDSEHAWRNARGRRTPIALGFHTGHWEVGLLVAEAARELKALHAMPFAGACTDPCDGRTQGTTGMMDSLPFRNDAAMVLRRLMRSLPRAKACWAWPHATRGCPQ